MSLSPNSKHIFRIIILTNLTPNLIEASNFLHPIDPTPMIYYLIAKKIIYSTPPIKLQLHYVLHLTLSTHDCTTVAVQTTPEISMHLILSCNCDETINYRNRGP